MGNPYCFPSILDDYTNQPTVSKTNTIRLAVHIHTMDVLLLFQNKDDVCTVSERDRERNNRSFTLNSRLISWPQHERNSSADHFAVTSETAASIHFIFSSSKRFFSFFFPSGMFTEDRFVSDV